MTLVELTLHDERKVQINVDLVAYFTPVGGNTSVSLTRILMTGCVEPIDVRETVATVASRLLAR